jgi:hypothetical protein
MNPSIQVYGRESIRMSPDGFSFYKPDGGKLAYRDFPNSSGALLTTQAPLFFPLGETVNVVAARHIPMLVPEELYDPSKDRDYLALQFDTAQLGATFADQVGAYRAVYFLTQNEADTVGRLPYPTQTVSEATLLYRFLCAQGPQPALIAALNDGFTDIVAVQKEELLLMNRFRPAEPEDTLYHIFNIIRQLNLRQPAVYLQFLAEGSRKLPQLLKSCNLNPVIL